MMLEGYSDVQKLVTSLIGTVEYALVTILSALLIWVIGVILTLRECKERIGAILS